MQLYGLTILHPFYVVDDSKAGLAPAIGGYDLMKSGRMALDIDNQLLWLRLTHSLTEQPSPNPTTSIPNTNVRSVVCFAELPSRHVGSPAVPSERDASVAPERSSVESSSQNCSTACRSSCASFPSCAEPQCSCLLPQSRSSSSDGYYLEAAYSFSCSRCRI